MKIRVAKTVVPVPNMEGHPITVGVFVDDECIAGFVKLDDAALFAVAKRKELEAFELHKSAEEARKSAFDAGHFPH